MSQLQTRKILTVNQVFEILLYWVETRDWERALFKVMPKRKLNGTMLDSRSGIRKATEDRSIVLDSFTGDAETEEATIDGGEREQCSIDVARIHEVENEPAGSVVELQQEAPSPSSFRPPDDG